MEENSARKRTRVRPIPILMFVVLATIFLVLVGCEQSFSGPYADQLRAASQLSSLKNDDKSKMVVFYEEFNPSGYVHIKNRPALVISIKNINDIDKAVSKIKEEYAGLDIPWLVVENFEDLVLAGLKDNDFSSMGLVITGHMSINGDLDITMLDEIDNLTGLNPIRLKDYLGYSVDSIESLPGIKELTLCNELLWLGKCPNIEKLNILAGSNNSILDKLTDPSGFICNSSLKEITVDDSALGKAAAYALYMDNPSIKLVNGVAPLDFDFTVLPEDAGSSLALEALIRYKADRIDLSGFTMIDFDSAVITDKLTIAGYGAAEDASSNGVLARYLTEDELSHISGADELGDTVIRLTTQSEVDGSYSDGRASYELSVYAEIIDLRNRTFTERTCIQKSSGDAVIVNGSGSTYGRFSVERFCDFLSELIVKSY